MPQIRREALGVGEFSSNCAAVAAKWRRRDNAAKRLRKLPAVRPSAHQSLSFPQRQFVDVVICHCS